MEEKNTENNTRGIYFNLPHENAPDFAKGKISIKSADFIEFLHEKTNDAGYVNIDLLVNREGKPYTKLNLWRPKQA